MAGKARRQTKKRSRRPPPRRSRPGLKLLTAIGLLFFVFCAAAGATLWFVAAPTPSVTTDAGAAATNERFSAEERKALDDLLRERGGAKDQ